ncbi:hypothetical protein ACFORJ_12225 [Corynebacterium hansenii]|uniref:Uncharacterized protein n=1 Tax=Corynebacterium hansenii TaxID=394964 RepID=A0ABV7ZRX7_9CORY|nr:hypothetical protein [Corynebacterium hansenii]
MAQRPSAPGSPSARCFLKLDPRTVVIDRTRRRFHAANIGVADMS